MAQKDLKSNDKIEGDKYINHRINNLLLLRVIANADLFDTPEVNQFEKIRIFIVNKS